MIVYRGMLMGCGLMFLSLPVQGWTVPAPVLSTVEDSLDPRSAVDAGGIGHAVWRERTANNVFRVWYTVETANGFAPVTEVSQPGSIGSFAPVIAIDGSNIHVAWGSDQIGSNWEAWYRKRDGNGWGTTYNASNTTIKSLRPAIAARNNVGPVVAWDEALYADDNYDTFLADWNGSGFNPAINLSNTAGGAVYGSVNVNLAVSPNGDVTAVWAERITGSYRVNARRRVGGVWQSRVELSTYQTGPSTPGIDVDNANQIHVVYEAEGTVWYQRWAGSAWTAAVGLPAGNSGLVRPKITADANGAAHIVADAFTDTQNNRDIFYSTNAGGSFTAWQNLSHTSGTQSLNADIHHANGRLVVTWQENSTGSGSTGVYNTWYTASSPPVFGPAGTISGFVRDPANTPVRNATVIAGGLYQALTGTDGSFSLLSVPPGTYGVTASKDYFSNQTVSHVTVTANQTTPVDFALTPQPIANVTAFTVTPGNQVNLLQWTNPPAGNYYATLIRVAPSGSPADPTAGTLVVDQPGSPGANASFNHTGLSNGIHYYYTAFARTDHPVYATGVSADATPAGPADLDRDGDVDLDDFAHFQACLSGSANPQIDPACTRARLDADTDVDIDDLAKFMVCISSAGVPADPDCAN